MASSSLAFCGTHPYFRAKEQCLLARGFLCPEVWHDWHVIAADPKATALHAAGFKSKRTEIVKTGIVLVIVDHQNTGIPVLLTAFIPSNPTFPAGLIRAAAANVDVSNLVDLDARLRGEA